MAYLTKIKFTIYIALVNHEKDYGFAPSVRELCALSNLKSPATIHGHLAGLEKLGLIKIHKGIPRGIELLDLKPEDIPPAYCQSGWNT